MKDIEIGPIRPPSESNSLLIRVTRGCHWNKCYFCGLYKSMRFSMRPIDETIEDIRRQAQLNQGKKITSCFLQDGDALVLKTDYLLRILEAINQSFPDMQYITSYARADSITRKSPAELKALRQAGLRKCAAACESCGAFLLRLTLICAARWHIRQLDPHGADGIENRNNGNAYIREHRRPHICIA